jgi:hypothetical protein
MDHDVGTEFGQHAFEVLGAGGVEFCVGESEVVAPSGTATRGE